ncbi:MAG: hypothetical protein AB1601_01995 [Planctomycetota bacterium]
MTERKRDDLESELSAYLDGELDAARRQEVRRRLAESDEARALLEDLRAISDGLGRLPRHRAPDDLPARLARHAERRLLLGEDGARRRLRLTWWAARVGAAAAVLVACVAVGWRAAERWRSRPVDLAAARERSALPAPSPETVRVLSGSPAAGDQASVSAIVRTAPKTEAPPADTALAPAAELRETDTARLSEPPGPAAVVALEPGETGVTPLTDEASEDEAASVAIVVRTESAPEYAAAVAVVAGWTAGGPETAPSEPGRIDWYCQVAGGDLEQRIAELVQVTSGRNVRLHARFDAADPDTLETVTRAVRRASLTSPLARRPTPVPPPTQAPTVVMSRMAPAAAPPAAALMETQPTTPARPTAAPPEVSPGENDKEKSQATPEKSASPSTRRARARPRGFDDRRDPETIRRDLHARHEAATEEPDAAALGRLFAPAEGEVPASAPAPTAPSAPGPGLGAATGAEGETLPAGRPGGAARVDRPGPPSFFDYLLSLAFPPIVGRVLTEEPPPAPREPAIPVRLHVTVLPPPPIVPGDSPTSAPTPSERRR